MKTLEDIIRTKNFDELSSSEFELVKDLVVNEEEFVQMKQFLLSVATISHTETINPGVKGNLDAVFNSKFQLPHTQSVYSSTVPKLIPFYNTLWFRAAAIFIIGIGIATPLLMNSSTSFENKNSAVAKLEKVSTEEANNNNTSTSTSNTNDSDKTKSKNTSTATKTDANSFSNEDKMNEAESSTMNSTNLKSQVSAKGKSKRVHELEGLPMYKRKNRTGGFVYTNNSSLEDLVASNSDLTDDETLNQPEANAKLKDYGMTIQPETTDEMLDILQSVY